MEVGEETACVGSHVDSLQGEAGQRQTVGGRAGCCIIRMVGKGLWVMVTFDSLEM